MIANIAQERLNLFYHHVANGDDEAFKFITLYTKYCHEIDDLVDESFIVEDLMKSQVSLSCVFSCEFFKKYFSILFTQIHLAGETYQASETTEKDTALGEFLSHEGNNVLRTVALLTGGYRHLVDVSQQIRLLTYEEHPCVENRFEVPLIFQN